MFKMNVEEDYVRQSRREAKAAVEAEA